jgi:hypothetical protein
MIFIVFHYILKLQLSTKMKQKPMEQIHHTSLKLAAPTIFTTCQIFFIINNIEWIISYIHLFLSLRTSIN